jgi:hypothetical protein
MATLHEKEILTLRVPRSFVDEVRRIAAGESESQSTILRRLLRFGLENERQRIEGGAR